MIQAAIMYPITRFDPNPIEMLPRLNRLFTQSVQDMVMLSTSLLNIKWTLKGDPKNPLASAGGPVILKVNSRFTLNQISGQVIEHEEIWDLSSSSTIAQAYFWASRRLFSTTQSAKDFADSFKNVSSRFSTKKENVDFYPDPTDPTKVFSFLLHFS